MLIVNCVPQKSYSNAPAAPSPLRGVARNCTRKDFARPLVALRFEGGFRPFSNENGFRLFGERIVLIMNIALKRFLRSLTL